VVVVFLQQTVCVAFSHSIVCSHEFIMYSNTTVLMLQVWLHSYFFSWNTCKRVEYDVSSFC
jgi:hypothetical protein